MSAQAFKVPSVFTAIDKFSKPVMQMEKAGKRFTSKLEGGLARANRVANKFIPSIGEAGKQMFAFAKSAAIAGGILATMSFTATAMQDYQDNMQSLQAITGVSDEKFKAYKATIHEVADAQKVMGTAVGKTFEIIASDIPTLLENEKALGKVANAAITLSKASGDDLATATTSLTATLNQFNLAADESQRVIDAMAAGNIAGNVSVSQLAEGVTKFGSILSGMNGTVEDAVALQEVLGKANLKGAEAGTNLRGVLLKLSTAKVLPPKARADLKRFGVDVDKVQNKSISLSERLREIAKVAGDEGALKNVFGEQNIAAAATLLRNLDTYDDVLNKVSGNQAMGKAMQLATTKTDTLRNKIDELKARWVNIVTGSEESSAAIKLLGRIIEFTTDHLDKIVLVVGLYVAALVALKVITVAVRSATIAYNVVVGIMNALQGKSIFALRKSRLAMMAQVTTTKIITGVTKTWTIVTQAATVGMRALSVALTANPIGAIIAGIVLLILFLRQMIIHWETWGKFVSLMIGPIGLLIFAIKSVADRWNEVKEAFKSEGIIGALRMIGTIIYEAFVKTIMEAKVLLLQAGQIIGDKIVGWVDVLKKKLVSIRATIFEYMLKPLKAILSLTSKIGIGSGALSRIEQLEQANRKQAANNIQETFGQPEDNEVLVQTPINKEAVQQRLSIERNESIKEGRLTIGVQNQANANIDTSELNGIPIEVEETGNF